jgi:hypothetical protein
MSQHWQQPRRKTSKPSPIGVNIVQNVHRYSWGLALKLTDGAVDKIASPGFARVRRGSMFSGDWPRARLYDPRRSNARVMRRSVSPTSDSGASSPRRSTPFTFNILVHLGDSPVDPIGIVRRLGVSVVSSRIERSCGIAAELRHGRRAGR